MRLFVVPVALALALCLASCGKRGSLERPEGEAREYPRVYPPSR